MADLSDFLVYTGELAPGIYLPDHIPPVTGFRQQIKELQIFPGPSSIRVRFRTLYKAHAASVALYRVVSGDFNADKQHFAALRLGPPDTRQFDLYITTGGLNRIEADTSYWVEVSCRDQQGNELLPGYIAVVRQMRTWKRNVEMFVDHIRVHADADPRGSGELFFQVRVWDAITRQRVQDNSTGQFDVSDGATIDPAFTVPFAPNFPWLRVKERTRIEGAHNRYGVFIGGWDDDSKDFFNIFPSAGITLVVHPPADMPYEPYEESKSTDTDDSARKFVFIDLPDAVGTFPITTPIELVRGKFRFTAYYTIISEVFASAQPLRWSMSGAWNEPDRWSIEVGDSSTPAARRAATDNFKKLITTHISRTAAGRLVLANSVDSVTLGAEQVSGQFDSVQVIPPASPDKPSLLLALDLKQGLRLAEMHTGSDSPRLVWRKQTVAVKGRCFVQGLPPQTRAVKKNRGKTLPSPAGSAPSSWGIFALSDKGTPLRIHPDGSSEALGPVTKAQPKHLFAHPSSEGWHVVLLDEKGTWQATSAPASKNAKTREWITLPPELGTITSLIPLPDGRAVYLGMDDQRNVGVWSPGVKKVRHFGKWEDLLPDEITPPEAG
jgi:hypothetical protein